MAMARQMPSPTGRIIPAGIKGHGQWESLLVVASMGHQRSGCTALGIMSCSVKQRSVGSNRYAIDTFPKVDRSTNCSLALPPAPLHGPLWHDVRPSELPLRRVSKPARPSSDELVQFAHIDERKRPRQLDLGNARPDRLGCI